MPYISCDSSRNNDDKSDACASSFLKLIKKGGKIHAPFPPLLPQSFHQVPT